MRAVCDLRGYGAIFDCDGTLIDSMGAWHGLVFRLAKEANVTITQDLLDEITTSTVPQIAEMFVTRFHFMNSAEELLAYVREKMVEFYATASTLRPGVREYLEYLSACGVRMSVASSSTHRMIVAGLEHCGIAQYMDTILSVDDVGASKREPLIYDKCREVMGTPLAKTWFFDDGAYAIAAARHAQYHTVSVWDNDISGTFEELSRVAEAAYHSFEEIPGFPPCRS